MLSYYQDGYSYVPKPEYNGKQVNIAIDSSKTNSCIQVFDSYGNDLNDYELRGEPEDDILYQIDHQRSVLRTIFKGAIIQMGGIEDIVTRKSQGMQEHESRYKITMIFANFIIYFQEYHNVTLELVNNWSWKSRVLPPEYRTDKHKKGSLDWHKDRRTKFANRKDDVTDAHCIKEYLCIKHEINGVERVEDTPEVPKHKYLWQLYSTDTSIGMTKMFTYNSEVGLKDTLSYIVNRLSTNEIGSTVVPVSLFNAEDIYTRSRGKFKEVEIELYLIIKREG